MEKTTSGSIGQDTSKDNKAGPTTVHIIGVSSTSYKFISSVTAGSSTSQDQRTTNVTEPGKEITQNHSSDMENANSASIIPHSDTRSLVPEIQTSGLQNKAPVLTSSPRNRLVSASEESPTTTTFPAAHTEADGNTSVSPNSQTANQNLTTGHSISDLQNGANISTSSPWDGLLSTSESYGTATPVYRLEWDSWLPWSGCSLTCGGGTRYRFKICKPAPDNMTAYNVTPECSQELGHGFCEFTIQFCCFFRISTNHASNTVHMNMYNILVAVVARNLSRLKLLSLSHRHGMRNPCLCQNMLKV